MKILEKIYFSTYTSNSWFSFEEWLNVKELAKTDEDFKLWLKRHQKEN
jgi:hypothetical protein